MKTSILIVDDHALVRAGLAALLSCQRDMIVIGEADDGSSALDAVRKSHPDVIVMDLMMPGMDGCEATRRIRRDYPNAQILILTSFGSSDELKEALASGAAGAILKDAPNDEVIEAIRAIARGESVIPHDLLSAQDSQTPDIDLTSRQADILHSVTRGLSNPEIARQFGISTNGVKRHLSIIFKKLGAANKAEAAAIALRKHLLKA